MFSIGTQVFTVNALGAPANMLISGAAALATFNTGTGAVVINGAALATIVYFYPSLPVMALMTYQSNAVNDEPTIAFDTRFAYQYVGGGWERLNNETNAGDAAWSGDDAQFFWGTTWVGANAADKILFVTNFNEAEPNFMRRLSGGIWTRYRPAITGADFLNSARIIVPFKNRLLAFNTWEGAAGPGINYQNRCRWSQIGNVLDVNAWRQNIPGRGNALDAATTEAIVTVEFIRDRLIVFFEQSTWEIVWTGNEIQPFIWQQINTELGAESTFSIIPFDKVAIGVGNVGVHACNGINVERIDSKIPDRIFQINNDDQGTSRVYGIRDYFTEMLYWAYPDTTRTSSNPYPNKVLVYNYKTGTWATNDDTITCFGYFQPQTGVNWDSTTVTWDDDVSWDSGSLAARFRSIVAGNQEGYVYLIDSDAAANAPSLQITDIGIAGLQVTLTVVNHGLKQGDFIYLNGIIGTGTTTDLNNLIFRIIRTPSPNLIVISTEQVIAGMYQGNGVISRVNNVNIVTKQYNFYVDKGRNAYVSKIDFLVDTSIAGQLQVNFYVSTNIINLLESAELTGSLLGTGTLDTFPYPTVPFEGVADRAWHPVYIQADGEVVQLQLTMSDAQMLNPLIRISGFEMHAMLFHAMPSSYRLQ
jgi:hypothetical protein